MINNLFSIFDPSTTFINIAWLTILVVPIILTTQAKKLIVKKNISIKAILLAVSKEIKQLTGVIEKKAINKVIICLFFSILTLNLIAILPFNFTITAHMSITFVVRISLWIATIINAIKNSSKRTLIHLTPMGTPTALINFIVLIETIRQMIRPITLAVRLIANIVAGHLLINLLSNFSMISIANSAGRIAPILMLVTLETAVALIQAYVITILITLYYRETF